MIRLRVKICEMPTDHWCLSRRWRKVGSLITAPDPDFTRRVMMSQPRLADSVTVVRSPNIDWAIFALSVLES